MKKIGFFLDNVRDEIDYSNPEGANPGIGGTQYLFWELSYFINKCDDFECVLFVPKKINLVDTIKVIVIEEKIECVKLAKEMNLDYLVIRGPFLADEIIKVANEYNVSLISWSHNFEIYKNLKNLKQDIVKKNICVSREQLDLLLDTEIYDKSIYIHNGISFKDYNVDIEKKKNRIVYIGNLYPNSGIEAMAKSWPRIKRNIPDCELYIIGGNDLYTVNTFRNFYSKKQFKRTDRIIKNNLYINKKELQEDVHFVGVKRGKEKIELMATANVGIANITDSGETFGLSAIEFEALGIPVVSINKGGIRETVLNGKTGILVEKQQKIADAVIYLLTNKNINFEYSENARKFVREKFDIQCIVEKWKDFFDGNDCKDSIDFRRFKYNRKKYIYMNYYIKKIFKFVLPISFYKYLLYGIKRIFIKLNIK